MLSTGISRNRRSCRTHSQVKGSIAPLILWRGGAQTLSCSKGFAKGTEGAGRRLDVDSYNALASTGEVLLEGNLGLRDSGESEISFARELPTGWRALDREAVGGPAPIRTIPAMAAWHALANKIPIL